MVTTAINVKTKVRERILRAEFSYPSSSPRGNNSNAVKPQGSTPSEEQTLQLSRLLKIFPKKDLKQEFVQKYDFISCNLADNAHLLLDELFDE